VSISKILAIEFGSLFLGYNQKLYYCGKSQTTLQCDEIKTPQCIPLNLQEHDKVKQLAGQFGPNTVILTELGVVYIFSTSSKTLVKKILPPIEQVALTSKTMCFLTKDRQVFLFLPSNTSPTNISFTGMSSLDFVIDVQGSSDCFYFTTQRREVWIVKSDETSATKLLAEPTTLPPYYSWQVSTRNCIPYVIIVLKSFIKGKRLEWFMGKLKEFASSRNNYSDISIVSR